MFWSDEFLVARERLFRLVGNNSWLGGWVVWSLYRQEAACKKIVAIMDIMEQYVCKYVQGVPSQNVFFKRAENVRKSICR